jgi:hypothetical protein
VAVLVQLPRAIPLKSSHLLVVLSFHLVLLPLLLHLPLLLL